MGGGDIVSGQDRLHSADASRVGQEGPTWTTGQRAGVPTEMAERLKTLEREERELRQANEILRKATLILRWRKSTARSTMMAVH